MKKGIRQVDGYTANNNCTQTEFYYKFYNLNTFFGGQLQLLAIIWNRQVHGNLMKKDDHWINDVLGIDLQTQSR